MPLLPDINLTLFGEEIETVHQVKYLGVILDSNLTCNDHIEYLDKNSTQKLGILGKVRKCLDRSTSLTLYKSLILPHFDYCDSIYLHTTQMNLQKLQFIQNSVCRMLLLAPHDTHVVDMHRDLNLMYLDTQRKIHMQLLNHQNVYFDGYESLSRFYIPVMPVQGRITRQETRQEMHTPRVKSLYGRKAFSFTVH